MNGSFPPQEGSDPKLSSIMVGPSESEATSSGSAVPRGISHRRLGKSRASASDAAMPSCPPQLGKDNAPKPSCPPQVGKDPKLLACMDGTGEAVMAAPTSNPVPPRNDGVPPLPPLPPPSQESSVATSLLSFKQTSPVLMSKNSAFTATKAPIDTVTNNAPTGWWQQDEEERFLLGLRMYGWGQWKRIQPIVKTRTNKQIKSHAQKREKVNPEIKIKYSKSKSRRGRISSSVLANDARVLSANGGDVMSVIAQEDEHVPSLEQMVKDVYRTNNTEGPNSRLKRYSHIPYHPQHSSKVVQHSPPSTQAQESTTETTATTVAQQDCKEKYTIGMEVYTRMSTGKYVPGSITAVVPSGSSYLYHIKYQGNIEFPSVSEDMIHTKGQYDEMIDELEKRFTLPTDAQVSRPHPLPAGTPVYAQFMNRLDPDNHAKWLPGTINSCTTNADGYNYHILFDNEEEAPFLEDKCVLHRLDYDKIEWHKQE